MTERDAAGRLERVRAVLRQQFKEEFFTPFPWLAATWPYEFSLFTEEQMRVLEGREWQWARPAVSLEEFLRRRAPGK